MVTNPTKATASLVMSGFGESYNRFIANRFILFHYGACVSIMFTSSQLECFSVVEVTIRGYKIRMMRNKWALTRREFVRNVMASALLVTTEESDNGIATDHNWKVHGDHLLR